MTGRSHTRDAEVEHGRRHGAVITNTITDPVTEVGRVTEAGRATEAGHATRAGHATEAGHVKGSVVVAVSVTGPKTTVAVEAEVGIVIGESVTVAARIGKGFPPRLLGKLACVTG